jgi:hypothetical protein
MTDTALTFEVLDDLALAIADGTLGPDAVLPRTLAGTRAGPLLELFLLGAARQWPTGVVDMIDEGALREFMAALRTGRNFWVCQSGRCGFMRLGDAFGDNEEIRWTGFGLKADKGMKAAGLPAGLAGQLVGATKELHSNVYEHSERSRTGMVSFAVHQDMAEFIVADSGIGVLASLKSNPVHSSLEQDGEALQLALQPGVSRHVNEPDRGHGFDLMFTGLLNRNSRLRFRSGSAAVTVDGCSHDNPVPIIRERPAMRGFLIAVDCYGMSEKVLRVPGRQPSSLPDQIG